MEKKKYFTTCAESGDFIEEFETYEDAIKAIKAYEDEEVDDDEEEEDEGDEFEARYYDADAEEQAIIDAIRNGYCGNNLEVAYDIYDRNEYCVYNDCRSMSEVAEKIADELGILNEIPSQWQYYFDFEAFGNDLKYEGYYEYTGYPISGYIEILV